MTQQIFPFQCVLLADCTCHPTGRVPCRAGHATSVVPESNHGIGSTTKTPVFLPKPACLGDVPDRSLQLYKIPESIVFIEEAGRGSSCVFVKPLRLVFLQPRWTTNWAVDRSSSLSPGQIFPHPSIYNEPPQRLQQPPPTTTATASYHPQKHQHQHQHQHPHPHPQYGLFCTFPYSARSRRIFQRLVHLFLPVRRMISLRLCRI